MSRRILLTLTGEQEGDELNLRIAERLAADGHRVALHGGRPSLEAPAEGCFVLEPRELTEASAPRWIDEVCETLGGLDACIHGIDRRDEGACLDDQAAGDELIAAFRRLFLVNREAARCMMREKHGDILFLLFHDVLYYGDYPSAPVGNQGKIAMMRSMARELAPFKVNVNALVAGPLAEEGDVRGARRRLEFLALKPEIPDFENLVNALEIALSPPSRGWTGQRFSLLPCGDALP